MGRGAIVDALLRTLSSEGDGAAPAPSASHAAGAERRPEERALAHSA